MRHPVIQPDRVHEFVLGYTRDTLPEAILTEINDQPGYVWIPQFLEINNSMMGMDMVAMLLQSWYMSPCRDLECPRNTLLKLKMERTFLLLGMGNC
jgi:hypothetical protein